MTLRLVLQSVINSKIKLLSLYMNTNTCACTKVRLNSIVLYAAVKTLQVFRKKDKKNDIFLSVRTIRWSFLQKRIAGESQKKMI